MKDLGGEQQKIPEKTEEVILTVTNGTSEPGPTRVGPVDADKQITIKNMWVLQLEAKDPKIIRHIARGEIVSGTNQFREKQFRRGIVEYHSRGQQRRPGYSLECRQTLFDIRIHG